MLTTLGKLQDLTCQCFKSESRMRHAASVKIVRVLWVWDWAEMGTGSEAKLHLASTQAGTWKLPWHFFFYRPTFEFVFEFALWTLCRCRTSTLRWSCNSECFDLGATVPTFEAWAHSTKSEITRDSSYLRQGSFTFLLTLRSYRQNLKGHFRWYPRLLSSRWSSPWALECW